LLSAEEWRTNRQATSSLSFSLAVIENPVGLHQPIVTF